MFDLTFFKLKKLWSGDTFSCVILVFLWNPKKHMSEVLLYSKFERAWKHKLWGLLASLALVVKRAMLGSLIKESCFRVKEKRSQGLQSHLASISKLMNLHCMRRLQSVSVSVSTRRIGDVKCCVIKSSNNLHNWQPNKNLHGHNITSNKNSYTTEVPAFVWLFSSRCLQTNMKSMYTRCHLKNR